MIYLNIFYQLCSQSLKVNTKLTNTGKKLSANLLALLLYWYNYHNELENEDESTS